MCFLNLLTSVKSNLQLISLLLTYDRSFYLNLLIYVWLPVLVILDRNSLKSNLNINPLVSTFCITWNKKDTYIV